MGCHFILQGIFSNPGIEPRSLALQADSLPTELPGKSKALRGQWAYFFYGVTVGMCSGVGPEGWEGRLRCFDYPSGGVECRGYAQYSAFAPNTQFCSQLFRSSSWLFWSLCSFWVQSLPQVPRHSFFLVPYCFFVFRCWRRDPSRYKHCSTATTDPRPSLSQRDQERRNKSGPQARPGETHTGRASAGGCRPRWGCETQSARRKVWPVLMLSRAPILASRAEWLE